MFMPRKNHEGYPDPTAHDALSRVLGWGTYVYICSPFHGDIRLNVLRARRYCRFAVGKGRIPIAPHLYFPQFLSESAERETAFRMNFELLKLCGEIWVFGEERSAGMVRELARAKTLKKTIRNFDTSCKEVSLCK